MLVVARNLSFFGQKMIPVFQVNLTNLRQEGGRVPHGASFSGKVEDRLRLAQFVLR